MRKISIAFVLSSLLVLAPAKDAYAQSKNERLVECENAVQLMFRTNDCLSPSEFKAERERRWAAFYAAIEDLKKRRYSNNIEYVQALEGVYRRYGVLNQENSLFIAKVKFYADQFDKKIISQAEFEYRWQQAEDDKKRRAEERSWRLQQEFLLDDLERLSR